MNCTKVNINVIGYLEGTLPEPERSQMEQHLEDCRRCHDYVDFVKVTLKHIDDEKLIEAGDSFSDNILRKLDTGQATRDINLRRKLLYSISAAAALFFAVVTGQVLGRVSYYQATPETSTIGEEMFFVNDMSIEPIESFFLTENVE